MIPSRASSPISTSELKVSLSINTPSQSNITSACTFALRERAEIGSQALECEIDRSSALAFCLGLVAGLDPVGKRAPPIHGPFGSPMEPALLEDFEERPRHVVGPVAGEQELTARLEHAPELAEVRRVHDPAFVVARFGPGVRIEEVDAVERTVGQAFDQRASIAAVHPNIIEPLGFDYRQEL